MNNQEIWKPIDNYEDLYEVSNFGRVFSHKRNRILRSGDYHGYKSVYLSKDGVRKKYFVHRLVAQMFIERSADDGELINHIDNNPSNNTVDNLEWCTQSQNIKHAHNCGRMPTFSTKRIDQLSLSGDFIRSWESISGAEQELGIQNSHISECCRGKVRQAGGYKWRYTP